MVAQWQKQQKRQMAIEVAQELVTYFGCMQQPQQNVEWGQTVGHDSFVQFGPYCPVSESDHSPVTLVSNHVA